MSIEKRSMVGGLTSAFMSTGSPAQSRKPAADCRPLKTTSPGAANRFAIGARRRGLRWTVGIGPWPIRDTRLSVLLLQSTANVIGLSVQCQPHGAAGHAQASATSPGLRLIIALDHLLSGVNSHSSICHFHVKKKVRWRGRDSTTNSDKRSAARLHIDIAETAATAGLRPESQSLNLERGVVGAARRLDSLLARGPDQASRLADQ
jgi:hypothetical protein